MGETNYEILVNKETKLDETYYKTVILPSLVSVGFIKDNSIMFDMWKIAPREIILEKEAAQHFNELRTFMREKGIFFDISCGFLTAEQQGTKYNYFLKKHGLEFTEKSACLPMYSEHNTGLALDCDIFKDGKWAGIAVQPDGGVNEETAFLHTVLHEFGFILRYPKGKEDITRMKFEPWHLRYVQKKLAKLIHKNQWTLEEYYEQKK